MTMPQDPTQQTITIPAPPPAPPAPVVTTFTAEDMARARAETESAFNAKLEEERVARAQLEQRMEAFSTDLTARQQSEAAAKKAAEDAAEEKRLAELSFGEKLNEFRAEQEAKVAGLQSQLEQRDLLMTKEREFNELLNYRTTAIAAVQDDILPELQDLVTGNTREQIDASVSALRERSASILAGVAQATQQVRQTSRGVGVTAPPVGPMDTGTGYQSLTTEQLRDMDMTEYAQIRGRLLGAAANAQRDRGMFG